jgi:hypothetical protein
MVIAKCATGPTQCSSGDLGEEKGTDRHKSVKHALKSRISVRPVYWICSLVSNTTIICHLSLLLQCLISLRFLFSLSGLPSQLRDAVLSQVSTLCNYQHLIYSMILISLVYIG